MPEYEILYKLLDLAGTFAFAISGAVAAKHRELDMFGIFAVAFTVACGGGIIRDLCIGAIPPVGLSDWRYLATAMLAALMTIGLHALVERLYQPVLLFDALGLSLFAVSGAHKALLYGHNAEVAILLGMMTAVGGGVLRDVLLNRIPVIFQKEIYASAALVGTIVVVAGTYFRWPDTVVSLTAIILCFTLRFLALRYHWNLPVFKDKQTAND
ncbi:trimeric intracellular cation channel family protein [Agriterribacter sp.]|uniref:trimeric intracellular cation channel family protein n=1 Tax=Agriterribacter sp. TaxID=2821509 RepID=UPI002C893E12|nr:trimeric intracellular cation channel family protein [Agriterribacter sp.]HRO47522.1 trimeric intracellular cation channel family protein [Agriterribacter sp.]HRQ18312.1 trimeric intracellular cation channel family protein [Agriterribacter sp.]